MEKVTLRIPATSANLGPGFDSIGCALSLYNTLTFERQPSGVSIDGCPKEFRTPENLAAVAYNKALSELGIPFGGVKITIRADVPVSRGLGSSAAMIVGGVTAAGLLNDRPLSKEEILKISLTLENHPDNLAPAIYGGLTASITEDGVPYTLPYQIHEKWHFTALIPDFKLSTETARACLPTSYSRADAVYNISHTSVLLKALEEGDETVLRIAAKDRLHEQYRSHLIKDYEAIKAAAKSLDAAFYLSGAGPTLMYISGRAVAEELSKVLDGKTEADWKILPLDIDRDGTMILN